MSGPWAHATALVESSAIGDGTRIWAFAHVMDGAKIGNDCNVGGHAFVEAGAIIGDRVTVKNHVCVWEGVTIEDDVFVGPQVCFTNDTFPRSPRMAAAAPRYARRENWLGRTRVGKGCSIGANSTVLPGVELGDYCMVAAGSVVTHDVKTHALVAGNPARPVGVVCRCGKKMPESVDAPCSCCGFSLTTSAR